MEPPFRAPDNTLVQPARARSEDSTRVPAAEANPIVRIEHSWQSSPFLSLSLSLSFRPRTVEARLPIMPAIVRFALGAPV